MGKLLAEGIIVVAVDLVLNADFFKKSPQLIPVECGGTTVEELAEKIPGGEYDALYELAWKGVNGPFKGDAQVQMDNAKLALEYAALAKKIGCKKILYAGTIAEESLKSLPQLSQTGGGMLYAAAKHCAHLMVETYCKNIGQDFVWMRFSNVYGPGNKTGNLVSYTLTQLAKGEEATFGSAAQPYDFLHVEDLLEAIVRLGFQETKENCYFIGSGKPRLLREYLLTIGALTGREDLIQIARRPDDGIVYTWEMFDTAALEAEIGPYVTHPFEEGIGAILESEKA